MTKVLVEPEGTEAFVQDTVPPLPALGVLQFHVGPEFCEKDTNVMLLGSVSVKLASETSPDAAT